MHYSDLIEAKTVYDVRHPETLKHWGGSYDYIDPEHGFFFHYDSGVLVLHSEQNFHYSAKIANIKVPSSLYNMLSGKIDLDHKLITISKEDVGTGQRQRGIADVRTLQKALKELKRYGVTDDFSVKGVPNHIPKSVGLILRLADPTDRVLAHKTILMYHGTSLQRWLIIQKQGLRPGNTGTVYGDLVPNYSNENIYLATTEKNAVFYGKRQAKKDGDTKYVVLSVNVSDVARLSSDDRFVSAYDANRHELSAAELRSQAQSSARLALSGRQLGEFAYHGVIYPTHLKIIRQGKV